MPHLSRPLTHDATGTDPRERGLARGRALARQIAGTAAGYDRLFTFRGIDDGERREAIEASLAALRAWDRAQFTELEAVAEGAGIPLVTLGTTVARTEILTLVPPQAADEECSTVAHAGPDEARSAQTWDWYAAFAQDWHLQRVAAVPGQRAHVGMAEFGMLGKIGLNDAGVGCHLNILRHVDDGPGGVPVHALLARILTEAGSVAEALDLARSAGVTSASVITVVDPTRVAMVELAGGRTGVLEPRADGWLTHTNHVLDPDLAPGGLIDHPSTSRARLQHLDTATTGLAAPRTVRDLESALLTDPAAGLVCRVPDADADPLEATGTLATIYLEPAQRRAHLGPGIPQEAAGRLTTLEARK